MGSEKQTAGRGHGTPLAYSSQIGIGPQKVGRFTIIRELGRGGMGVAYLAYDEQLDRKVAVKLVTPESETDRDSAARRRLLREAQTLARVSHRNVVTVFEAGTHGAQVYMAMEFVHGQSLKEWMRAAPRHWREVVGIFRQAGAGLQAVHAAGLVHRDFKPSNVLVADDGRVLVLDFGLARFTGQPCPVADSAESSSPNSSLSANDSLTQTGLIMGTPGYIAPERLLQGTIDTPGDQFSFCVSLYKALYGKSPFPGTTRYEVVQATCAGAIDENPPDRDVPRWLHAAVVRGLRPQPDRRWPSMEALVAVLDSTVARQRRRRRLIAGGIGAAIAGLVLCVALGFGPEKTQLYLHRQARAQLANVWDEARRAAVERAIVATGVSYAEDTWRRTEVLLDRYAEAWITAHVDATQATLVRHEQPQAVLEKRLQCLRGRRRNLHLLTAELSHIAVHAVPEVILAVRQLPPISSCADQDYLNARIKPPEDPDVAARVQQLRDQLARAAELEKLGMYEEGLSVADQVVSSATKLDYRPLLAEATLRRGYLQERKGDYQRADSTLRDAYFLARKAEHPAVALAAAIRLIYVVGYQHARYQAGREWGRHAEVELDKLRSPEHRVRWLVNLGITFYEEHRYQEAENYYRRAMAVAERSLDRGHILLSRVSQNLGNTLSEQKKYPEAELQFRRALHIRQQALGTGHPYAVQLLLNLGFLFINQGALPSAAKHFQRALIINTASVGPDHPYVGDALRGLGAVYQMQGDHDRAAQLLGRSLAIHEQAFGPEHPRVADLVHMLGAISLARGHHVEATALCRRALSVLEKTGGPDHPSVTPPLITLAEIELGRSRPSNAVQVAERALAVRQATRATPVELAEARFVLARALGANGTERARALQLARSARAIFQDAAAGQELAAVEAWLRR